MRRVFSMVILVIMCIAWCPTSKFFSFAEDDTYMIENDIVYKIYNESGDMIAEKQSVYVGDSILTTEFVKYKVVQVDSEKNVAFVEFEERLRKPDVRFNFAPTKISQQEPVICLYMTHNDESYIVGDGVDSVYGAGGIHDIAKNLKGSFEDLGITTYIDETLHIPHDNNAYSRSSATVKYMLSKYSPDAIFDIHRDGASRNTYVKKVNGEEKCKVRIVVGKSSSNYKIAEQFALYLLSVASEVCDWLFLDIYYASGHYNQGLYNKALLFEVGSHLVEKTLVEKTVPELAKVVKMALFNTTVDVENGDLTINGNVDDNLPEASDDIVIKDETNNSLPTINEVLNDVVVKEESGIERASTITYFVVVVFGAGLISGLVLNFVKKKPKKKKRKK